MQRVEEHHKLLKTFCKNNAKFEAVLAHLNASRRSHNRTSNTNSGQVSSPSVNIATIEEVRPLLSVVATSSTSSSTSSSSVASTSNFNNDNSEE